MLKIWGRTTSSNVQKVLWCCAELGIEYERVDLRGPFGGNRDPEYLAMNPNGRVPTIQDDSLVLWESNAICRYLATTRHGERLYPSDPKARANVERWMDWQLATSGPPMAGLLGMLIRARPEQRDHAAIEAARLQALDDRRRRARRPPLSGGTGADPCRDRLRNDGLPLARVSDRAAAIEEPQSLVRAHAGASWVQNSHRNPDHVMVRWIRGRCHVAC